MKLRIRGNSVRLRLGRGEVASLLEKGGVEETTVFGPGQSLAYAVRLSESIAEPRASFREGRIELLLPTVLARKWGTGDEVAIAAEQAVELQVVGQRSTDDRAPSLRLLIEKDFECLNAVEVEDQADAYPHPLQGIACKPEDERTT